MPLRSGKSRETIRRNIKALVHEWEDDGSIGNSHPADRTQAVRQAVAIALNKAGVSRKQRGRPRRTRDEES